MSGDRAAVLAFLADGESWSSSALAIALGASQRTVQRALDSLAAEEKVRSLGRRRARRCFLLCFHPLGHNGQPPSAEQERKRNEDLDRLQHETPQERAARLRKDQENRSFLKEVLQGFDFQLVGDEVVDGRPTCVLRASPHPGYHAQGKYGKMLSKVEGRIWIDKQDFGWVKVDGQVTLSFSTGLFLARVRRGSRTLLDETYVGDGVWMPKRPQVRANAQSRR
jgi:hypothetical protein